MCRHRAWSQASEQKHTENEQQQKEQYATTHADKRLGMDTDFLPEDTARVIEEMERVGVVGPLQSNGSREIYAAAPPGRD